MSAAGALHNIGAMCEVARQWLLDRNSDRNLGAHDRSLLVQIAAAPRGAGRVDGRLGCASFGPAARLPAGPAPPMPVRGRL